MSALRVGIVAAEHSGDLLGAGLMRALRARRPDVRYEGVGGDLMIDAGLTSWYPMERLSVMGVVEVLRHLPALLTLRRSLFERWRDDPPDIFIGVDAPDFNLGLETRLRRCGVTTAHYVCPTVWAWREGRVKALRKAVDLILSILPFEERLLARHDLPVTYVGHPLAAEFPMEPPRSASRAALGIDETAPVLAILPGSRRSEIQALSPEFIKAGQRLRSHIDGLEILVPLVNDASAQHFGDIRHEVAAEFPGKVLINRTREALAAADVVLTASGTATLECLLSKRPMVVGYRVHPLTYWLVRLFNLINVDHVAMANLLAGERLAPEFLQHECSADRLEPALLAMFEDVERVASIRQSYEALHHELRTDTNERAADAVLSLLEST